MECCVCYQNNNILTTECNHKICLNCLIKLTKTECPYCEVIIIVYQILLKKILSNKTQNEPVSIEEEDLVFFGYRTPYGDLSDNQKELLNEMQDFNYNLWKNIRNDINTTIK